MPAPANISADLAGTKPGTPGRRATTRCSIGVIAVLFLLLCIAGAYFADTRRQLAHRGGATPIRIDPAECEFEAGIQRRFRHSVSLHNQTARRLHIRSFRVSCECTRVEPSSLTIPPLGTKAVTFTLDLTSAPVLSGPRRSIRHFEVQVLPEIDGYPHGVGGFPVVGKVYDYFGVTPALLNLKVGDESSEPKRIVAVHSRAPMREVSVRADLRNVRVGVVGFVPETTDFRVQIDATRLTDPSEQTSADKQFSVWLGGELSNGTIVPPVEIPVRISAFKDVRVMPATIVAGASAVGAAFKDSVILSSRSGSDIDVSVVPPLPPGIDARVLAFEGANSRKELRVKGVVNELGWRSSSIQIAVRYPKKMRRKIRLAVPVSVFGKRP